MNEHKSYTHTFDADLLFGIYMFPFLLLLLLLYVLNERVNFFVRLIDHSSFIIQNVCVWIATRHPQTKRKNILKNQSVCVDLLLLIVVGNVISTFVDQIDSYEAEGKNKIKVNLKKWISKTLMNLITETF